MLIGYVSDERYLAIADAAVEFQRGGVTACVARSSPRGAVLADLEPGEYLVTLARDGYGPKSLTLRVQPPALHKLHHFRLLSNTLLGYVWPRWSKSGERGEFRVHSPEPYRLSLWRYGLEKEQVRLLGWFDEHGPRATMQITPDGDYTQGGVAWNKIGHGSPHHTQFALAPEHSGLYYFHAEGESGSFFAFPWVVAPKSPSARLAVLASTNTWNAYNNFGGRSNYVNTACLPPEPLANARQDMLRYRIGAYHEWTFPDEAYAPLSFERPEPHNFCGPDTRIGDPVRGRMQCGLAPMEWRFLGWLERERFGYDLYSDHHLHTGELPLDRYKALAVPVHPEYWSRTMYERVKEWVFRRGGRLLYLGGNGLNCEIEFLGSDSMRCRTQLLASPGSLSHVDPNDPTRQIDSRFARTVESEANLLGVVTTDSGIMTAAPYRVLDASHWAFAGAGLRDGDLFGHANQNERCHGGASGHETDKRSPSSPANCLLLAKGINPDEGGAEIVYHEPDPAAGSAVFSVGSINWVGSLWVDDAVSKITANVVRRFMQ
ncbi:MAG: carboxypeptidase regulatory-like domain-containing protein [Planctomycetota bacterium]|nr:carboxypeptidase regulatory-like domain-containing protein [Planctomycetota bacterium]